MADLDLDEMVEVGDDEWEKAARDWVIRGPLAGSRPWVVLHEGEVVVEHHHFATEAEARHFKRLQVLRAILSAVLPLALAGAREALDAADGVMSDVEDNTSSQWRLGMRFDETRALARATLSHIDTLIGKADNKGGA